MEKFENKTKPTLTADGLKELYIDRRIKDYDKVDRSHIILSKDIHGGLVDTYGQFDLTELSSSVEEREIDYWKYANDAEDTEIDDEVIFSFDFESCLQSMAEHSLEYIKAKAEEAGKPFEARVISYWSPDYYNFTTDDYEMEITKNPFDTIEELIDFIKSIILDKDGFIGEEYNGDMIEYIEDWIYENTDKVEVGDKEYESLDEALAKYKK